MWAAYKTGSLALMGFTDLSLSAADFKAAFEQAVVDHYHAAWTLFAQTKRGFVPVGIVFGAWAPNAQYMVATACWFPWATSRNVLESIVNFLNRIRKEMSLMFFTEPEHRQLYEVVAMHGIISRVGTSYIAIPGKKATVFETRPL